MPNIVGTAAMPRFFHRFVLKPYRLWLPGIKVVIQVTTGGRFEKKNKNKNKV